MVAGYPWFGEWSRDLFTSYEGLFLCAGRVEEGREVLLRAAATVSEGMLANTADVGTLEYNTIDATLWSCMRRTATWSTPVTPPSATSSPTCSWRFSRLTGSARGSASASTKRRADVPHAATGCPFRAWSVAELIRVHRC